MLIKRIEGFDSGQPVCAVVNPAPLDGSTIRRKVAQPFQGESAQKPHVITLAIRQEPESCEGQEILKHWLEEVWRTVFRNPQPSYEEDEIRTLLKEEVGKRRNRFFIIAHNDELDWLNHYHWSIAEKLNELAYEIKRYNGSVRVYFIFFSSGDMDEQVAKIFGGAEPPRSIKPCLSSCRHPKKELRSSNIPNVTLLDLTLLSYPQGKIRIQAKAPSGEYENIADLPYSEKEMQVILKVLEGGTTIHSYLQTEHVQVLRDLDLIHDDHVHAEFHKMVGKKLYAALFSGDLAIPLHEALRNQPVVCRLCFGHKLEDVILAQFPWELIRNGNMPLLLSRSSGLELIRYVMFSQPPSPLRVEPPLKLLFISLRSTEYTGSPNEIRAITDALKPLYTSGRLSWEHFSPSTWGDLQEYLDREESKTFHIIHFDGHGAFARKCVMCGKLHHPHVKVCECCKKNIDDAEPKGYLCLKRNDQESDSIEVDDLKVILGHSRPQLAVISACGSGIVGGSSLFNGIVPGFIQAGIPAVVGVQGSPTVQVMAKFMHEMYKELAKGKRLPEAVNSGRSAIYLEKPPAWFVPVVYLRGSDETYGQLFCNL
jgi:hypothetical protein